MKNLLPRLLVIWAALVPYAAAETVFTVPLPTPLEHYKAYNVDTATLELLSRVLQELDPPTRELAMKFFASGQDVSTLPPITPDEAVRMFRKLGLEKHKAEFLEVFLHKSQVFEIIPEKYRDEYTPIVHDALLAFMDGLSEDRLAERLIAMSRVPQETPRGEKILILASRLPALQKVGQIIARLEGIPPDISQSLQTLESGIRTMSRDELVAHISEDVGPETIEKYQIRFDDNVLAEASVGAVIKGSFQPPNGSERSPLVCKLIKPYAASGLPQEMDIVDGLIELADKHGSFYGLAGMPLKELFQEIKVKLGEELLVTQEQANFKRAYEYYRQYPGVRVPRIYDFSTPNVTFMEFLAGEKINMAFPGDQRKRTSVARRLADVMSFEVLFSREPVGVFHGDPHAGNVMHITDNPADPYQIGLLDWGLLGEFDREHRKQMVQLNLAFQNKDRKKLHRNVGALLAGGMPEDPAKQAQITSMADECLRSEGETYAAYGELLANLTKSGYVLDSNLTLFIKSQLTLMGIYRELDPDLKMDRYLKKKVSHQVIKEFPKRLLLLPAWNYRGYRSLLSNGDVFGTIF